MTEPSPFLGNHHQTLAIYVFSVNEERKSWYSLLTKAFIVSHMIFWGGGRREL